MPENSRCFSFMFHMALSSSKDLVNWMDMSERLKMPKNAKHGTVLEVPQDVLDRLLAL